MKVLGGKEKGRSESVWVFRLWSRKCRTRNWAQKDDGRENREQSPLLEAQLWDSAPSPCHPEDFIFLASVLLDLVSS